MSIVLDAYYMYRKLEAEVVPLDTEIERTLMNLKKVRAFEKAVMAKQRDVNQNIPIVAATGDLNRCK